MTEVKSEAKQSTLNRNLIDEIISLGDFGKYTFECNSGAEYHSDNKAVVPIFLTHEGAATNDDSERKELVIEMIDGTFQIDCEAMNNAREVEHIINQQ